MQNTKLRVRQKRAFYGIEHGHTGLYARIPSDVAPPAPQPFEDTSNGDVVARHGHVRFEEWETATWFTSNDQAIAAQARYLGAAPVEIVRKDPT